MRYFFPRRIPTDRQLQRAKRALAEGRIRYMRQSSENGVPLVWIAGLVYEELTLAALSQTSATTRYHFYRMPTKHEVRRFGT